MTETVAWHVLGVIDSRGNSDHKMKISVPTTRAERAHALLLPSIAMTEPSSAVLSALTWRATTCADARSLFALEGRRRASWGP